MSIVYLDDVFIPEHLATISALDRGFLFGDGVYEVIPVYDGKLLALDQHFNRLTYSLQCCHIPNPFTLVELNDILHTLLEYNAYQSHQKIYIHITRGKDTKRSYTYDHLTPTVYIRLDTFTPRTNAQLQQGVKVGTRVDNRWMHCDIKSTSLLANVLYSIDAKKYNYEEIILTRNNLITEGISSNVFVVMDNIIHTPIANTHILNGITRKLVLQSATELGMAIKETNIHLKQLYTASEVWITSSTREILPVSTIDDTALPQSRPLWQRIYNHYQTLYNTEHQK